MSAAAGSRGALVMVVLLFSPLQECVDQCGEVLAVDASNRKALYRRGACTAGPGALAVAA